VFSSGLSGKYLQHQIYGFTDVHESHELCSNYVIPLHCQLFWCTVIYISNEF